MLDRAEFAKRYPDAELKRAKIELEWETLEAIARDFQATRPQIEEGMEAVRRRLARIPEVHSLRSRIKDELHLVEKCIRKQSEDPSRKINVANYRTEVTDLAGVRAIHLYKSDWAPIHEALVESYSPFHETPIAYYRNGDDPKLLEEFVHRDCIKKEHPKGYRSVHYIAKTSPTNVAILVEVQVRTIFEEGWSEVDHRLNYPRKDHFLVDTLIQHFNRLAGNADELASYLEALSKFLREQGVVREKEVVAQKAAAQKASEEVESLRTKIDALTADRAKAEEVKKGLEQIIKAAEASSHLIPDNSTSLSSGLSQNFLKFMSTQPSTPSGWLLGGFSDAVARQNHESNFLPLWAGTTADGASPSQSLSAHSATGPSTTLLSGRVEPTISFGGLAEALAKQEQDRLATAGPKKPTPTVATGLKGPVTKTIDKPKKK